MRTTLAVSSIALALFATACSDLPSGITESSPAPHPGGFQAELRCTAYVDQPRVTCEGNAPAGSGPGRSLIVGGQNVYVRLASSGAGYNPSDSIFQVDVTVQNLMAQAFGTPDGEVPTGLTVFFATGPTPVPEGGNVTVHNEDGEAIFFSSLEPYFTYDGLLYTGEESDSKPWQFKMDPEVTRFVFTVFVRGELPHESSILLFRPQYEPDGGFANGIWGTGASEVFAAGFFGQLMRYDGTDWTVDESPTEEVLWDVWGSSGTDVWAVGDYGTIVHWNGTDWTTMDSGLEESECGCGPPGLYGVWASGPNDAWAVGDEGVIVHFDGTQWVPADTMPVYALYGVWGTGPDDVFAAGEDGGIFHYDGTSWSQMTSGLEETGEYLNVVWGLSSTDVYATASNGLLHYDGVSWSPVAGAEECEHIGIWGSGPDDLFVSNLCGISHWDGDTWAYMDPGGFATELWGTSPTHVLANTNGGIYRGRR
jgi:hypothetical protein